HQLFARYLRICLEEQRPENSYYPDRESLRTIPKVFLLRQHQVSPDSKVYVLNRAVFGFQITKLPDYHYKIPSTPLPPLPPSQTGTAFHPGELRIPV